MHRAKMEQGVKKGSEGKLIRDPQTYVAEQVLYASHWYPSCALLVIQRYNQMDQRQKLKQAKGHHIGVDPEVFNPKFGATTEHLGDHKEKAVLG